VRVVLEEVERLRQVGQEAQGGLRGAFAVGTLPTLGPYLMGRLLPLFRDHYPEIRLHLREEKTGVLLERLAEGQLAVLLVSTVQERPGLRVMPLFEEALWLVVPANAPLAKKKQVTPRDIESMSYIELEEGHCLREDAVVHCRLNRRGLRDTVQATSIESARQMVMAGIGCTIVPAMAVPHAPEKNALVHYLPFAPPRPMRTINYVYRTRAANAAHLEALGVAIRDYLAGMRK
jgi:LysR family transcriptional regulator, hydrogen peroxide-inducible genes activator